MTEATPITPHESDEAGRVSEEGCDRCIPGVCHEPVPGVMEFVGAHVGGELAEERWR
jgi:hypothetical protein